MSRLKKGTEITPRLRKILLSQAQKAAKEDHPHIIIIVDEKDIRKWYIATYAMEDVWAGAEFYYSLVATNDFPQKPPIDFTSYTNTALFDSGGRICVSIGEFHANSWRASLGMLGFAEAAVVGGVMFYESYDKGGIRLVKSTDVDKRRISKNSHAYNAKQNVDLHRRFEEYIECHPEKLVVKRLKLIRAGARPEDLEKLLDRITPEEVKEQIAKGVKAKDIHPVDPVVNADPVVDTINPTVNPESDVPPEDDSISGLDEYLNNILSGI